MSYFESIQNRELRWIFRRLRKSRMTAETNLNLSCNCASYVLLEPIMRKKHSRMQGNSFRDIIHGDLSAGKISVRRSFVTPLRPLCFCRSHIFVSVLKRSQSLTAQVSLSTESIPVWDIASSYISLFRAPVTVSKMFYESYQT